MGRSVRARDPDVQLNILVPLLVDAVIVFTIVEGAALFFFHKLTGGGIAPQNYLLNLVSGACLMAALRAALLENAATWVMLWLLVAGIAHTADLLKHWRRRAAASDTSTSASGRRPP
jgi:hypothetical protein